MNISIFEKDVLTIVLKIGLMIMFVMKASVINVLTFGILESSVKVFLTDKIVKVKLVELAYYSSGTPNF